MKHFIFSLILSLSIIFSNAQNGGQYAENNSVRIEFVGYGTTKVVNKQSCEAVIRVTYNSTTTNYTIPGLGFITISTPVAGSVRAKATTNCGNADFGNVEFTITTQLLPVKFVSLKAEPIGNNELQVTFEVAEATNVKQYNIQVSKDGVNWQTVTIVWPDNIQPNKIYSTKVSLSGK